MVVKFLSLGAEGGGKNFLLQGDMEGKNNFLGSLEGEKEILGSLEGGDGGEQKEFSLRGEKKCFPTV